MQFFVVHQTVFNISYSLWIIINLASLSVTCPYKYVSPQFIAFIFWRLFHGINTQVQFSHSVVSNSLQPHGLQHTRPPCPSPTHRACSNSCPSSHEWCHPTISSSVTPFSSCPQSFPASRSFPMNQFFTSGGQSIGTSASVLPKNIQDWFPLGLTALISLLSMRESPFSR